MIVIDVSDLGEGGKKFAGEEPGEMLDVEGEQDLRADGPVCYDLTVQIAGDSLVVRGKVAADISFACVRCGEFFGQKVADSAFCRVFEEIAKDAVAVDLTADVRESIILAFPTSPLCDERCKGLCSQCGTNLNRAECQCKPKRLDDRWDALDELK